MTLEQQGPTVACNPHDALNEWIISDFWGY